MFEMHIFYLLCTFFSCASIGIAVFFAIISDSVSKISVETSKNYEVNKHNKNSK